MATSKQKPKQLAVKPAKAEKKHRDDGTFPKIEEVMTADELVELRESGNLTFTERRILQAKRAEAMALRGIRLGRVSKAESLHPLTKRRIIKAIESGAPVRSAFALAGICKSAISEWTKLAEHEVEPYKALMDEIKNAEEIYIVRAATKISSIGMNGNWTALAWGLERQHPDRFALRNRIDVGGVPNAPVETKDVTTIDTSKLNLEQLLLLKQVLESQGVTK